MSEDQKSILPDALEGVWDDELHQIFSKLEFRQQTFALDYLEHGVASKAIEKAYGLSGPSAWARGSVLLRDVKVRAFITAYREKDIHRAEDDRHLIRTTYREAMQAEKPIFGKDRDGNPDHIMDVPDHDVRIKAGQALAKLDGLNAVEVVTINPSEEFRKLWGAAKVAE